jgi:lipopolysaccharide transport system permease protein
MLTEMRSDLRHSRELAWRLAVRDIKAEYRRSFVGIAWALMGPLTTTLSFSLLRQQKILTVSTSEMGIPYPVYVMIGTLLWGLFTEAYGMSLSAASSAGSMLTKVRFPREAVLISGVLKLLFRFSIRLVMLAIFIVMYKVPLTWSMLLMPIPIALLIMMGMAVGLTLMPLTWLLDDLSRVASAMMSFAFFLTPVVYPPQQGGILGTLSNINPVTPLLVTGKELMTGHSLTYPGEFVVISIATAILFFFGLILFRIAMPILIERMSA